MNDEREQQLREYDRQLAAYQQTFMGRLFTLKLPQSVAEGAIKGISLGALTTSILLTMDLISPTAQTAKNVLIFYAACTSLMAGVGYLNRPEPSRGNRR